MGTVKTMASPAVSKIKLKYCEGTRPSNLIKKANQIEMAIKIASAKIKNTVRVTAVFLNIRINNFF